MCDTPPEHFGEGSSQKHVLFTVVYSNRWPARTFLISREAQLNARIGLPQKDIDIDDSNSN